MYVIISGITGPDPIPVINSPTINNHAFERFEPALIGLLRFEPPLVCNSSQVSGSIRGEPQTEKFLSIGSDVGWVESVKKCGSPQVNCPTPMIKTPMAIERGRWVLLPM